MSIPVDPEGKRLPIKLDATSNGEFVPATAASIPTSRATSRPWTSSPPNGA
jgi:hypothetical protein